MPRGQRFSAEQMVQIINECKERGSQGEVARRYGISDKTISNWKQKFKNMNVPDVKKLKSLEEENSRLKRMIANMAIDIEALKEINAKKW
jgi:putative transposase